MQLIERQKLQINLNVLLFLRHNFALLNVISQELLRYINRFIKAKTTLI